MMNIAQVITISFVVKLDPLDPGTTYKRVILDCECNL